MILTASRRERTVVNETPRPDDPAERHHGDGAQLEERGLSDVTGAARS
jgi:hypothetical protein